MGPMAVSGNTGSCPSATSPALQWPGRFQDVLLFLEAIVFLDSPSVRWSSNLRGRQVQAVRAGSPHALFSRLHLTSAAAAGRRLRPGDVKRPLAPRSRPDHGQPAWGRDSRDCLQNSGIRQDLALGPVKWCCKYREACSTDPPRDPPGRTPLAARVASDDSPHLPWPCPRNSIVRPSPVPSRKLPDGHLWVLNSVSFTAATTANAVGPALYFSL